MSAIGNVLAADRWERVPGTPLGDAALEYRNLYRGANCIGCHVFLVYETLDLARYQARLRETVRETAA